jgi:hypothetical protein
MRCYRIALEIEPKYAAAKQALSLLIAKMN